MAGVVSLTHTFGGLSSPVPLNYLDANYTDITAAIASLNTFSNYLVDTGAANAYIVTLGAGLTCSLSAGLRVQFKAANANTQASTLNVNGTGAKNILTIGGLALTNNMIPANGIIDVIYDGTQYLLLNAVPGLSSYINSLGGDVALNNTANYFDGPVVANGTAGTWLVGGTVTLTDTSGSTATMFLKLWDGTSVIASARADLLAANGVYTSTLVGIITAPAGNLRISVRDSSSTSGAIKYNASGNAKDSTIVAIRIA
jgi:hypothetical protein